jgi:hypothetical protein
MQFGNWTFNQNTGRLDYTSKHPSILIETLSGSVGLEHKDFPNRFPHLKRLAGKILHLLSRRLLSIERRLHRSEMTIISDFSLFAPYSMGPHKAMADLTVQSANRTFPLLVNLIEAVRNGSLEEPVPIHTFSDTEQARDNANHLKLLFDKYGSDKAVPGLDYHHVYGSILETLGPAIDILEIGLGTNYPDVASNMGAKGRPGASLRAFKEFLPEARIYGADIDRRILFKESRISTFFVDQTKPETFQYISDEVGHEFDLIIDDGLHSPNANLATLIFACKNLRRGGWLIVEDISPAAVPIWQVISQLLSTQYKSFLIAADIAFLFAINRKLLG